MNRLVKLDSYRPGDYANNDVIKFRLPGDGLYDLSKSYISFNARIDTTPAAGHADGVYNVYIGGLNRAPYKNNVLVRNSDFRTQKLGTVESCQDINILNGTLDAYSRDIDDMLSEYNYDISSYVPNRANSYPNTQYLASPFRELFRLGDVESKARNVRLPIKLSDILGIGRMSVYPSLLLGDGELKIQLDTRWVAANQIRSYITGETLACANIADQGIDYELGVDVPLTTTPTFATDSSIKIYVGAPIAVTRTINAVAATVYGKISQIDRNGTDHLEIYTSATLGAVANGQTVTTISLIQDTYGAATITFSDAELVLYQQHPSSQKYKQFMDDLKGGMELAFSTWAVENANTGAGNFSKLYNLEPNTMNAILLLAVNQCFGQLDSIQSYRFFLNNRQTTDRDVKAGNSVAGAGGAVTTITNSGIYFDRLNMLFNNMGGYRKLKAIYNTYGENAGEFMMPQVIPQSDAVQSLKAEVNGIGAGGVMRLYKQIERVIDISNKGVAIM